jgi:uncharacterized protein YukE
MADQVEIHYQSLTTCADGHRDAAGRTDEVDQLRQGATLPAGSLGKLPQSGEIQAAFEKAWSGTGTALADLEKAFEGIADRLVQVRDHNQELDDVVSQSFDKLRGGN